VDWQVTTVTTRPRHDGARDSTNCGDVAGGSVPQGATITAECTYDSLPASNDYWDWVVYNGVGGWTGQNNVSLPNGSDLVHCAPDGG
jgi:hypothetical protein